MPHHLVEIRMSDAGRRQRERIARALDIARSRLRRTRRDVPTLASAVGVGDGGIVFVVDGEDVAAVRRLLSTALLPPGSVRPLDPPFAAPAADPRPA